MRATILASAIVLIFSPSALAMPVVPAPVLPAPIQIHGCHHGYSRDVTGWHRHDDACRTLRGLVGRKNRHQVKS